MKSWYVYIVRCKSGALYTGITLDVHRRVDQHNKGIGAKSVKALGLPVHLVWHELMENKSSALKAEIAIKKMNKKEKEFLFRDKGDICFK